MTTSSYPIASCTGTLSLAGVQASCHVLNDGRAVLAQPELLRLLGGSGSRLGPTLRRNPLTKDQPLESIDFLATVGQKPRIGYEAGVLVDLCGKFVDAFDGNVLPLDLYPIAKRANSVIRACATSGIRDLVYQAAGFCPIHKDTLQDLKLAAYILTEKRVWERMYGEELWVQFARLSNYSYVRGRRPKYWGRYVRWYIYDAVDDDVSCKLKEINPNPRYGSNHHQFLTDFGREEVKRQTAATTGIARSSYDYPDFTSRFNRAYPLAVIKRQNRDYVFPQISVAA